MELNIDRVMVGELKCVRITGIEGFPAKESLPQKYIGGPRSETPAFWSESKRFAYNRFVTSNKQYRRTSVTRAAKSVMLRIPGSVAESIGVYRHAAKTSKQPVAAISVGDVMTFEDYQKIEYWLKVARVRLQEARRTEWSGSETIKITGDL